MTNDVLKHFFNTVKRYFFAMGVEQIFLEKNLEKFTDILKNMHNDKL